MQRSPYNLQKTLQSAQQEFASADAVTMTENSGCEFDSRNSLFKVPLLNNTYTITFPEGKVASPTGEASLIPSILLLHYLSRAGGEKIAGRWTAFRELPGGGIYTGPFYNRAVLPFVAAVGHSPENFAAAAQILGGRPAGYGDVSFVLDFLPRVPLLYILWQGDEEFPPKGNILFDQSIKSYLNTEDCTVAASLATYAIKKTLRVFA